MDYQQNTMDVPEWIDSELSTSYSTLSEILPKIFLNPAPLTRSMVRKNRPTDGAEFIDIQSHLMATDSEDRSTIETDQRRQPETVDSRSTTNDLSLTCSEERWRNCILDALDA